MPLRHVILSMTLAALLASCRTMTLPATGFLDRSIQVHGHLYPYSVYVPRMWTPERHWPVILFLHGSGERGTDGLRATQIGIGSAIRSDPSQVPAIVVFPQAPPGTRWLGEPAEAAMAALEATEREFGTDRERTYLTGLSMGGYGVWHLALAHPGRFAALVPVCGGLLPHETTNAVQRSPLTMNSENPYALVANVVGSTPVWIFHGDADPIVPVEESRQMTGALQQISKNVRYTEYAGVGHNSWERAYRQPDLWQWLFEQTLKQ